MAQALVIGGIANGEYREIDPTYTTWTVVKYPRLSVPPKEPYPLIVNDSIVGERQTYTIQMIRCGTDTFYFLCDQDNFSDVIIALCSAYSRVHQNEE